MFGLEVIKAMNAEAGEKARWEGTKPAVVRSADDVRGIPFLGDACDDIDAHAERLDTLFVDTSGFGRPGEPALTQEQFIDRITALVEEHGPLACALSELGQFQGYVAIWKAADLDRKWNNILL